MSDENRELWSETVKTRNNQNNYLLIDISHFPLHTTMIKWWILTSLILVNSNQEAFVSLCRCPGGYFESSNFTVFSSVLPSCSYRKLEKVVNITCGPHQLVAFECVRCNPSCKLCYGPSDGNCLECSSGYFKTTVKNNYQNEGVTETESSSVSYTFTEEVTSSTQSSANGSEKKNSSSTPDIGISTSVLTEEELLPTESHRVKKSLGTYRNARSIEEWEDTRSSRNEDDGESSGDTENFDNNVDNLSYGREGTNSEFVTVFDEENSNQQFTSEREDFYSVQGNKEPLVKREYPNNDEIDDFVRPTEIFSQEITTNPQEIDFSMSLTQKIHQDDRTSGKTQENLNFPKDVDLAFDSTSSSKSSPRMELTQTTAETTTPISPLPMIPRSSRKTSSRTSKRRKFTRTTTTPVRENTITGEITTSHTVADIASTEEPENNTENPREYPVYNKESHFRCVSRCPDGTYLDKERKACEKCHNLCKTCIGPNFMNCTACQEGNVQINNSLQNSVTCASNCFESYYNNNGICEPCHPSCDGCEGPNNTDCIKCHSGYEKAGELNDRWICTNDKSLSSLEIILPLSFVVFLVIITILIWIRWQLKLKTLTKPFVNAWMKYIKRNDNGQGIPNLSSLPKNASPTGKHRNEYTSDPSNMLCAKCGSEKLDDGYELPVPSNTNGDQNTPFKSLTMRSRRNNDPLPPTPNEAVSIVHAEANGGQFYTNQAKRGKIEEKEPVASGTRDSEPQPSTSRSSSRMFTITDNHYANSEGLYANC